MPRLLITGGAGFIGTHIVDAALADGWDVRVVDSFRADVHPEPSRRTPLPPGVRVIEGDLADPAVAEESLDGVDAVSHQAAKVGLGVDFDDAPDYARSNVEATAVLLAAMARHRISRLVLASSMVVYGEGLYRHGDVRTQPAPRRVADLEAGRFDPTTESGEPLEPVLIEEDDRLDPRNVYAATKLAQEHLAGAWSRATAGTVAALRYHNVFGPGMPSNTPYAGVASIFRSALERGQSPRLFEDGGQRRDFIDVRDVATANIAALRWTTRVPVGTFRPFNVGSGVVRTVGDFATTLARELGGPAPIVTAEFRLGDVRHITASSARARSELGWAPLQPFERAVADFARAPMRPPGRGRS